MEQAGWVLGTDGILMKGETKFSFTCDIPSSYPEASVVQQNLMAVGIDMQMKNGDWAQTLTTRYTTDFVCNYTDPGWDNFPDRRYRWHYSLIDPMARIMHTTAMLILIKPWMPPILRIQSMKRNHSTQKYRIPRRRSP